MTNFGPDFGGATVYTTPVAGYATWAECRMWANCSPNLKFTLAMENGNHGAILNAAKI